MEAGTSPDRARAVDKWRQEPRQTGRGLLMDEAGTSPDRARAVDEWRQEPRQTGRGLLMSEAGTSPDRARAVEWGQEPRQTGRGLLMGEAGTSPDRARAVSACIAGVRGGYEEIMVLQCHDNIFLDYINRYYYRELLLSC